MTYTGIAADLDLSTQKTYCSVGNKIDVLNGYGEAELLRVTAQRNRFLRTANFHR